MNTTHGVYGFLNLNSLPKGASYIRRILGEFKTSLEETVFDNKGEISLYDAATIQSAIRHEGRVQLLWRWLRQEGDLSLSERVTLLREAGAASDSRDKCLKALGLAKSQRENITVLFSPQE